MNRPEKVRIVFAELSAVMGDTMSPADLLECAWLMVDYANGGTGRKGFDLRTGPTPFEELSLDILFERWSWKLVCREFRAEEPYTTNQRPEELIDQLLAQAA